MSKYLTLLYYKYTTIQDPEAFAAKHLAYCKSLGLLGRILIAREGINGTLSGLREDCETYMTTLREMPIFEGIEFKVDEEESHSFSKLHVRARTEVVTFGDADNAIDPSALTAPHIDAEKVAELLEDEEVVFLDVRNQVEHSVGKFKGARTLDIQHFREFAEKLNEIADLKEKKVVAYCTGGIRCEKATAYMLQNGFKDVSQIDGGIIKYGKETGGKNFEGKCYVFDRRLVVDVNQVNPSIISHCMACKEESIRMINCANPECNEHFCQCENCSEKMEGCCSADCQKAPKKREYNGTGYYLKGEIDV